MSYTRTHTLHIPQRRDTRQVFEAFAVCALVFVSFAFFTPHAEAAPREIKTVEYSFGSSAATTTTSAVPLFTYDTGNGATTSWRTVNPTSADQGFNFQLHGSNIVVKNAWVEYRAMTATTAASMSNVAMELSTCPGTVDSCASAPAYKSIASLGAPTTVLQYVNSAEHNVFLVTADATAALANFTDAQWETGIETILRSTATGGFTGSQSAKLYITYEIDYETTAHTEVKTVRFPISATTTGDQGSRGTSLGAGTTQAYSYLADIPDLAADSDILDVYFEVSAQMSAASTNGSLTVGIVGGSTSPAFPTYTRLGDTLDSFTIYRPPVDSLNFQPNIAQHLLITPGTNALQAVGGELVVTYKYSTDAPVQTETVKYMVGQTSTSGNTSSSTFTISPVISNTGLSVKNIYVRAHAANTAATNLSIRTDIDDTGGAAATTSTYAFSFTGGEQVGTNRVIHDMSRDASSFVSGGPILIQPKYSAAGGNPIALELFITFTWSGNEGGAQTKTVEYSTPYQNQGHTAAGTAGVFQTYPFALEFPETNTKTLRSAYFETVVVSSDATSPAAVNFNINGATTSSTGSGSLSHTGTGEAMTFRTITGATTTVTIASTTQHLYFNAVADVSTTFVPKAVVTYDVAFDAISSGGTLLLSGFLYEDEGATLITSARTLGIAIGTTTTSVSATTSLASGAWNFTVPSGHTISSSTPILVWLDGYGSTTSGAVFTKASSTNAISNLNLYQNHLIIRHEGTSGTTTTLADLGFYSGTNDSDIQFTATTTNGSSLTVSPYQKLYIWPSTSFTASGTVEVRGNASSTSLTDGSLHLATSSTYVAIGTTTLAGSFTASTSATYTHATSALVFNATTTGKVINPALASLGTTSFTGVSGGWTIATSATTSNLTVGTSTARVTTTGSLFTITGNLTNYGSLQAGGTTTLRSASSQVISGDSASSTFTNLGFGGVGEKRPDLPLTASGNVLIESGSTLIASSTLTVGGHFTNNGTVSTAASSTEWVERTTISPLVRYRTITYGGGLFVALPQGDDVTNATTTFATSPDGISWTARTSPAPVRWGTQVYGNGTFVALPGTDTDLNATTAAMYSTDGTTWLPTTLPVLMSWESLAFGNGIFLATGYTTGDGPTTTLLTSSDGITWTVRTAPVNAYWYAEFGGGHFVAVSSGDGNGPTTTAMTSPDGITWTTHTTPVMSAWSDLIYGGGQFVAVSYGDYIIGDPTEYPTTTLMTSSDGISWTPRTLPVEAHLYYVHYGNGMFLAFGDNSTLVYSIDGITWFNAIDNYASVNGITYGAGMFIAVVDDLYSNIITSPGGIPIVLNGTVPQSVNGNLSGSSAFPRIVTQGSGAKTLYAQATTSNFVVASTSGAVTATQQLTVSRAIQNSSYFGASSSVYIGDNLINTGVFTQSAGTTTFNGSAGQMASGTLTFNNLHLVEGVKLFVGTATTTNLFVEASTTFISGNQTNILGNYTGNGTSSFYGGSWGFASTGTIPIDGTWSDVAEGNGVWVSVRGCEFEPEENTCIIYSTNGLYWATATTPTNGSWQDVTYGNGLFVVVGSGSVSGELVMTSPDGLNWTLRSAAGNNDYWNSVTYGNGRFVAVGGTVGDEVMYSTDGINWSTTTVLGDNDTWSSIAYGEGIFVAVGCGTACGGDDVIMSSPNGVNWTSHALGGNNDYWSSVAYGNGQFVTLGYTDGERAATSPDGVTWTLRSLAGDNEGWDGLWFGQGIFFALSWSGGDDITAISADGVSWERTSNWSQGGFPMRVFEVNGNLMGLVMFSTRVATSSMSTTTFAGSSAQTMSGALTGIGALGNTIFSGAGTKTFSSNASTTNFTIQSGSGAVVAPSHLTVYGDYANSSTFTAGNGTTTFASDREQTLSGTMTGSSAFSRLVFTGNATKTIASNASTTYLVNGTSATTSTTTLVLPSHLTVLGNFSQLDSMVAGSGTTTFGSTTASQYVSGNLTGSSSLNHVVFSGGGTGATTDGLVGYWTFDDGEVEWLSETVGSTTDMSGNGNDGAFINMSSTTNTVAGYSGNAISFNGTDEDIAIQAGGELSGLTAMTVCTWLNVSSAGAGLYPQIFSTYDSVLQNGWELYIIDPGATFGVGTSYGIGSGVNYTYREVTTAATTDTWHHVCAKQNGDSLANMRVYVDGADAGNGGSAEFSSRTSDAGNTIYMGSRHGTRYTGLMDEVRVYNRALTDPEILAIYESSGYSKYIQANASTTNFVIDTDTSVEAPTLLSIAGNYLNNGTFSAGSGTTTFRGTGHQTASGTMTGASAFTNLEITNTSGTTTFGAALTASGHTRVVAPGATLEFVGGGTTTLASATIQGSSGNLVKLRSSSSGVQSYLDINGAYGISYVNVKDSNACPTAETISASNVENGGNTSCWGFVASDPTISSAASQTFAVSGATTTISQITITDNATPAITSANDIRIKIATSSVRMLFDTSDTSATLGGTASSKVSGTVSYEGGGSVLVIDVTSNFSASDTLTISGLSFAQFTATNTATIALGLYTDGASDTVVNASDNKTVTITGSFTVANHTLGQVSDGFSAPSATDVEVLRFKITPAQETFTISNLVVNLTGVDGIVTADLTNARLFQDNDADGTYSTGDTERGGGGTVAISGQSGTITWSTSFSATTTRDYVVVLDTASIRPGDFMTVSLTSSGITATGDLTAGTVPYVSTVSSVQHSRGGGGSNGGHGGGGGIGGDAPAGQGQQGGGGEGGGGDIDTNTGGTSLGDSPGFEAPTGNGSPQGSWATGGNGYDSDGSYATETSTNDRHTFSSFGFNVPGGNTITGIEVKIEGSATTPAGEIEVALSWDGGGSITSYKTTGTLTSTDAIYELGGPSDTWGRSWTPSETADGAFTIEVRAQPNGGNTLRIDAIRVRVYHQASGGGGGGGGMVFVPREYLPETVLSKLAMLGVDTRRFKGWYFVKS